MKNKNWMEESWREIIESGMVVTDLFTKDAMN
jgi:hypothetical protein